MTLLRKFPSDEALIALTAKGVTHIVVHERAMNQGRAPTIRYNPVRERSVRCS